MPDAFASSRGSRLNCRFAVNGIQYASSELSLAAARAGSFAAKAAGSRSLYTVVSLDARQGDRPAFGASLRVIDVGAVAIDRRRFCGPAFHNQVFYFRIVQSKLAALRHNFP